MGAIAGASPHIVGRDDLRRRIVAALTDANGLGAGTVVLSGEAGIGKTVLARAAAADIAGARIVAGACLPLSTLSVPYLALRTMVRAVAAREGDDRTGLDFDDSAAHVLAGLDDWLDEVGDGGRVVLLLDDIQWADAATLDALLYLIADPLERPRSLLFTRRSTDAADSRLLRGWLANVRRMPRVALVDLGPLDRAATMEQMADLLGEPPHQELVQDVWERTRGHPYLTTLALSGVTAGARHLPARMSTELVHAVRARVLGLDAETVDLLRVLAVAGRPLTVPDMHGASRAATGAAAPDAEAAMQALTSADEAGVIARSDDDTWWFRHPLTAEILEQDMPDEAKRSCHAALLRSRLGSRRGLDVETSALLADHAAGAGARDVAFHWAMRAYRVAVAARDFETAARFIERALALRPSSDPALERELGLRRVRALQLAGVDAALIAIEDLLERIGEDETLLRAELEARRILLRVATGFEDPTAQELAAVLSMTDRDRETSARALALAFSAMWNDDPVQATAFAEEGLALARRTGAREAEAWSLAALAQAAQRRGASDAVAGLAGEAIEVALRAREGIAFNSAALTMADETYGERTAGRAEFLQQYRARSQGAFAHTYVVWLALIEAEDWFTLGRWDRCEDALRLTITGNPSRAVDMIARAVWGRLAVRRGFLSAADGHFARVEERAADAAVHLPHEFAAGRAEAALDRHEPWNAVALLGAALPRTFGEDAEELLPVVSRVVADARTTRARGDPESCEILEAFVVDTVAAVTPRDDRTRARLALAGAERTRAAGEDAPDLWEAAADANAAVEWPWEEAYACRRAAERHLTHGRGDRAAAAPLLRRGLDIAMRLGARPLEGSLRDLARFGGIRLPAPVGHEPPGGSERTDEASAPSAPAERPALEGLTSREAEIVDLILEGRTYREIAVALFVSEKTVSSHISNILRKTGAANRIDLARRATVVTTPS